jgi:hypothetical protein
MPRELTNLRIDEVIGEVRKSFKMPTASRHPVGGIENGQQPSRSTPYKFGRCDFTSPEYTPTCGVARYFLEYGSYFDWISGEDLEVDAAVAYDVESRQENLRPEEWACKE